MALMIMLVVLGIIVGLLVRGERARRRSLSTADRLRLANQQLEAERRRTRRAMNEAAGQSWRIIIE